MSDELIPAPRQPEQRQPDVRRQSYGYAPEYYPALEEEQGGGLLEY